MKKFPIDGFPKNKKKVVVMEGRTPYTIYALQDVFACIHTFLGPKLITDVLHADQGRPVPR
jgi:hypothetical protein